MIVLVVGGTRSGKSMIAESLAAAAAGDHGVTYIATAHVDPGDEDHRARVRVHQARRPSDWITVECTDAADLVDTLRRQAGVVLVDSLGTWVTRHADLEIDAAPLLEALRSRSDPTVIVSEEVGLAVHPPSELGRRYVDTVGDLNQAVAREADRVLLVVAGRAIDLPVITVGEPPDAC